MIGQYVNLIRNDPNFSIKFEKAYTEMINSGGKNLANKTVYESSGVFSNTKNGGYLFIDNDNDIVTSSTFMPKFMKFEIKPMVSIFEFDEEDFLI